MKTEKEHIDHIRKKFKALQSKEDLAQLLNEAKVFMYGEDCKSIKLKSLTYYANPEICKRRYTSFTIKKKSGGERIINAPVKGLRSILRVVNFVIQCIHEPHKAATGFVQERSIVDNARVHVGRNYVYNLDLKDFFHSFDRNRVKMGFWMEPFNLRDEKEPIAFLLASLCTHPFEIEEEKKTVLPQGSPTSPTITNILCYKLDRRLNGLAKRFNLSYTRYADDITFSSSHNVYQQEKDLVLNKKGHYNNFRAELERIIKEENLSINPAKTRLQKNGYSQEVTGLIVNEKVNVHRKYVKQLRMWLYYWEKYGYKKAEQIFRQNYVAEKGYVKTGRPGMENVIDGKLEFLKMVKGEEDPTYKKLILRFNNLINKPQSQPKKLMEVNVPTVGSSYVLHNPQFVVEKLQQFTADPIMKWATHFWDISTGADNKEDSLRGVQDHFAAVNSRFEEFVILQKYNSSLWWKVIYPFVFQKKLSRKGTEEIPFKWGEYDLQIGWQFPKIVEEWTIKNYDQQPPALKKTPFEMSVSSKYITDGAMKKHQELYGKDIAYFGDVIQMFKREIEFREDTKDLYYEIRSLIRQELVEFNVNGLEQLKQFFFFTYTAPVLKAIRRIFRMIQIRTEQRNLFIECKRLNDQRMVEFRIIHEDSNSFRSSEDSKIIEPSGDLLVVIKNLIGLCDFEIEAKFADGIFRISYLNPKTEVRTVNNRIIVKPTTEPLDDVLGFTYILKFPI